MSGVGPGPVAQGLKEALVETLNGILCPVQGVRAAAEEQVKVLEVTEGECGGAAAGVGKGRFPSPRNLASCISSLSTWVGVVALHHPGGVEV